MNRTTLLRLALLEALPFACLLGMLGIVIGSPHLAQVSLAPLILWIIVGLWGARALRDTGKRKRPHPVTAMIGGLIAPIVTLTAYYRRLGLYRCRWLYDLAATSSLLAGGLWWWSAATDSPAIHHSAQSFGILVLVAAIAGIWLRRKTRPVAHGFWHDVLFTLEGWQHRRRRADEFAYEAAIAKHLEKYGFGVIQGERLSNRREADIVVRPKGKAGPHDFRDVMVEMKAHMVKTAERDRALGQIETYAREWAGPIVLMLCGEYRPELLEPLRDKILSLNTAARPVALIVKGRQAA